MNKKIRILIIVGILLIAAIITKFALADSNENEYTEPIGLGREPIPEESCYENGIYDTESLIEGQYPLTEEEIEILSKRYTKGDATTVEEDREEGGEDSETSELGIINTYDAEQILKWYVQTCLMEQYTPSKAQIYVGDIDLDGDIDAIDACAVLRFVSTALLDRTDSIEDFIEQEKLVENK